MSPVVLVSLGALDAALIAQGVYGVSRYRRPPEREPAKKKRWPAIRDD
jgi:hypothetical protein